MSDRCKDFGRLLWGSKIQTCVCVTCLTIRWLVCLFSLNRMWLVGWLEEREHFSDSWTVKPRFIKGLPVCFFCLIQCTLVWVNMSWTVGTWARALTFFYLCSQSVRLINMRYAFINVQCIRKALRPLHFFHVLIRYSLRKKGCFFSSFSKMYIYILIKNLYFVEAPSAVSWRWPGGRFMTVINTSSPLFPLSSLLMLHLQTPWLT